MKRLGAFATNLAAAVIVIVVAVTAWELALGIMVRLWRWAVG